MGRPKGAKAKPKTLEAWLQAQLSVDLQQLPPPPTPPKPPKKPFAHASIHWKPLTPEQRSELGKKARRIQTERGIRTGRLGGKPKGWTNKDFVRFCNDTAQEAKRIFKIMDQQERTPENDMAKAALQHAFEMIAQPLTPKDRLAAVRTVLEYTKQKPATQSNVTVKTAEDFLDELEEYDSNQSGAEEAPNP